MATLEGTEVNATRPKRRSIGAARQRDRHGTRQRKRARKSLRSFTITGDLRVVKGARIETSPEASREPAETSRRFHQVVEEFKRWSLESALSETRGNRTEAAKLLGIQRTYLLKLIREFEISVPLAQPNAGPDILAKKSECDQDSAAASASENRDRLVTPGSESTTPS